MLYDFLFVEAESGEEFFVECATKEEAWGIATENFGEGNLRYRGRFTVEEAEVWGLDTY